MKELERILCNTPGRSLLVKILLFPGVISNNLQYQVSAAECFVGQGTNSKECSAGINTILNLRKTKLLVK